MFANLNPQLPYYLLLFLLTIILRFIRAYRSQPKPHADSEAARNYRTHYFYFGLELVNVSAGVFILLSEHATQYFATVMILYVILVILSFFFEEEGVGRTLKTIGHISVSMVVVAVTLYAFLAVEGLKEPAKTTAQTGTQAVKKWRVALPYMDTTLNRNFGVKTIPIQSIYVVEVTGVSRLEAIQAAKSSFYSEKGPAPFITKSGKTPLTMIVLEGDIVVELQASSKGV